MSAPGEAAAITGSVATVAPLAERLEIMINLTPEAQTLLNPFVWPGALNDLLVRQFGFTLSDLIAFLVLSFFFWKVLVLFILPGIYFRVMLYTDEMESHQHSARTQLDRRRAQLDWSLTQVLDAISVQNVR